MSVVWREGDGAYWISHRNLFHYFELTGFQVNQSHYAVLSKEKYEVTFQTNQENKNICNQIFDRISINGNFNLIQLPIKGLQELKR